MKLSPNHYRKALADDRRKAFTRHSLMRNKPCLCKSGKKFKNCCLRKAEGLKGER